MYVSSLKLAFMLIKVEKKFVICSVKPCFLNNPSVILNAQNGTRFRKYNFGRKKPLSRGFGQYKYKKSTRGSGSGNEKRGNGKFRSPSEIGSISYLK